MARQHIPQLDGFRALAVILVLLAHSAVAFTRVPFFAVFDRYGSLGVQLFFVLSGFLITRILLDAKGSPHYFKNFFARRGLRIYPLYYALLLFVAFSGIVKQHGVHWWVYILYLSNLVYGHAVQPAPLGPMWSLAVEEQFYLVWPFVIWNCSQRTIERLSIALVILVTIARFVLPLHIHNTIFQLDALAAGSFLACKVDTLGSWRKLARVLAFLLPFGISFPEGPLNNLSQSLQVIGGAAAIVLLLDNEGLFARIFRAPSLRYIGKVSYGVYLLHSLVFAAFLRTRIATAVIDGGSIVKATLCLLAQYAIVLVIASLSFYLFERPFLRLKRFFEPRVRSTLAAIADGTEDQLTPGSVAKKEYITS